MSADVRAISLGKGSSEVVLVREISISQSIQSIQERLSLLKRCKRCISGSLVIIPKETPPYPYT